MSFAVACAVLAALCSAVGAQLQHSGVRAETQDRGLRLRTLAKLVRNRDWIRGFAVLFACAVLQILALTFAPVSLVAPIVVLALPMVALLNAHSGAVPIDRAGWIAVGATSLAVGVFVTVSAGAVAEVRIPPGAVLTSGIVIGAAVLLLGIAALVSRGNARCVALAMAAGAAYGLVSVLLRDVTYSTRIEGLSGLPPLSALGVVVAFLAGSWLIQLGYDSGPADVVVGSQTVVNPLVATVIGMTLLDETTSLDGGASAVLVACGVVAMAGVLVLARHHPDASAREQQRAPALG
ncbi:DMT family transporter [Amycolatopsis marina]|nr:DMT family transporter [Amycolatopsis marina]